MYTAIGMKDIIGIYVKAFWAGFVNFFFMNALISSTSDVLSSILAKINIYVNK